MSKEEALKIAQEVLNLYCEQLNSTFANDALKAINEALEQPAQEPVADDELHLAKHAKEYHGLTLNQFKLMCNEADKRYEGQFANSVDKHLAVESFYEGFKVAIKSTTFFIKLTDDEIYKCQHPEYPDTMYFARAVEQELKTKNGFSDIKEKNHG